MRPPHWFDAQCTNVPQCGISAGKLDFVSIPGEIGDEAFDFFSVLDKFQPPDAPFPSFLSPITQGPRAEPEPDMIMIVIPVRWTSSLPAGCRSKGLSKADRCCLALVSARAGLQVIAQGQFQTVLFKADKTEAQ